MPRQSEKVRSKRKINNLIISQLNKNAYDERENDIISHIESIGNLIIKELNGLERDYLKENLLNFYVTNSILVNNLTFSSSRKSLKQVLDDFHTFNYHIERQHRTIGIGDHDINNDLKISMIPKCKKRRTSPVNSSSIIDNNKKKTPITITRTICTRSSKLNTLNNNQEPIFHEVLSNQERKHRSYLRNNINKQNSINNIDNTIEKSKDI